MLLVFGTASSINVRKVLWACDEIGVAYQRQDPDNRRAAAGGDDPPAQHPGGLVPVVVDDGEVLWESNVIVRYLAAKHGRYDLLPDDAAARAHVEKWMDWQASEFNNSWRYAFQCLVRKNPAFGDPAALAQSVREWTRHVAMVDAQIAKTGGFIAGPRFTVADIPIGLSLNRWHSTPLQHPAFPAAAAYFARLMERPAFLQHGCNGTP